jgi:hypothetical protein
MGASAARMSRQLGKLAKIRLKSGWSLLQLQLFQ